MTDKSGKSEKKDGPYKADQFPGDIAKITGPGLKFCTVPEMANGRHVANLMNIAYAAGRASRDGLGSLLRSLQSRMKDPDREGTSSRLIDRWRNEIAEALAEDDR